MSEELHIDTGASKAERYKQLLPQVRSLIEGEPDLIANMANVCSALRETFNWWWVGFYIVREDELVLGPFQGPIACTRIGRGKGVCGTAWEKSETVIVPDVEQFPGHIACSSATRSEIVIPLLKDGNVMAVLDVDSELPDHFDDLDALYLEKISALISGSI